MEPKVSVIIPVYNVEKFLNRCVDSVLNQTLSDIEVILVDDGSPDHSPAICDEYASLDQRVKVIHKPNGGLASARNAGMKIASGKYMFFVDSDDWLELNGLELLYDLALKYKVDFVRYRAIRSNWPGLPYDSPCMLEEAREIDGGYYDKAKIINNIYPKMICTSSITMGPIVGAWGSLYNRDFLLANNLFFDESIKFSEDMIFSAKVVYYANSFYYHDLPSVYHYFYNDTSISHSFRATRWESCKEIIRLFDDFFLNNNKNDYINQLMYLKWFCIFLGLNERNYLNNIDEKKAYINKILYDKSIDVTKLKINNTSVSFKQKIYMLAIKLRLTNLIARL